MNNENTKDNSEKWAAPTSSYEDAKMMSKLIKQIKDKKKEASSDIDK